MILTQLEGIVDPQAWDTLRQAFRDSLQQLPDAIVESHLVQDQTEPRRWRIQTLWRSPQALQAYRAAVETPAGVLMFRKAGVEPTLTICDVRESTQAG